MAAGDGRPRPVARCRDGLAGASQNAEPGLLSNAMAQLARCLPSDGGGALIPSQQADLIDFLTVAARTRFSAPNAPEGPIALSKEGVEAVENAVNLLLGNAKIRRMWDSGELRSVVKTMIVALPQLEAADDMRAKVVELVERLQSSTSSLVAFSLANVEWGLALLVPNPPVVIANSVIGILDEEWIATVEREAAGRPNLSGPDAQQWLAKQRQLSPNQRRYGGGLTGRLLWPTQEPSAPVVCATWVDAHSGLAVQQGHRRVAELIDLSLLMEPNPESVGVPGPVRDPVNRPGVRGLTLDRTAVGFALHQSAAAPELVNETLSVSSLEAVASATWHAAEPLPLGFILPRLGLQGIRKLVETDSPLTRRVRTAARWYAKAQWAEETIDAVLALGIALDSLVGDPSGLPTRALSERFALLEASPTNRPSKANRFNDLYKARSAIAHGSIRSDIDLDYVSNMAADVRWAAQRLLALSDHFSPVSQDDFRDVFEGLRWGTRSWNDSSRSP
jgi:hypothetical protein